MKFNEPVFTRARLLFIVSIIMSMFFALNMDLPASTQSPEYKMCVKIQNNVVRVKASFKGEMDSGFGFVVGERKNGRLLIATCNHLVRHFDEPAEKIEIMFRGSGKWIPVDLLKEHELIPRDLAVLEVQKPVNFSLEKKYMSPANDALKGIKTKFIGREDQWWIPQSDLIVNSRVPDKNSIIRVETNLVKPGTSGAPLVSRGGIIGMIISDSGSGIAKALSINRIRAFFIEWQYPWSLEKGPALVPGGKSSFAVLVTDNNKKINWVLSNRIGSIIKQKGGRVEASALLTEKFVSSGKFNRIFSGNPGSVTGIRSAKHIGYLILGKKSDASFRKDSEFEGLITAVVSLEIRIVSSKKGTIEGSFNISQRGAGFTKLKAEETAVESVLSALSVQLSKSLSLLAD